MALKARFSEPVIIQAWERPHQALGYRTPGEVFEAGQQNRCLQEQEEVLPSGIDTFPLVAADSLNLALSLSK